MLKWYGDAAMRAIKGDARAKVLQACLITERYIKESMRLGGRTESGMITKELVRYKRANKKRGIEEGQIRTTKGGDIMLRKVDAQTGRKVGKINSYASKPGEVPRVQTGTLRRSYTHEMTGVDMLPIGRVGTNLLYAKWLEFGISGGRIITPKKARVLSWLSGGRRFFAKSVRQGAIAPRPHVRPALAALASIYRALFGIPLGTMHHGG